MGKQYNSSCETCLKATERQLPYGITQCYLPLDIVNAARYIPARQASTPDNMSRKLKHPPTTMLCFWLSGKTAEANKEQCFNQIVIGSPPTCNLLFLRKLFTAQKKNFITINTKMSILCTDKHKVKALLSTHT